MSKTQRTAAFKKKVALEALKEDRTMGQLASQYGVHPAQIGQWKKALIDAAESVFERKGGRRKGDVIDREALERIIGRQAVELDYFKKKFGG